MDNENPHSDVEYKFVRRPLSDVELSEARQRIVDELCHHFRGHSYPQVILNIQNLASRANVNRRTVQRFFDRYPNLFEMTKERPGSPNLWKINWDFTFKRKNRSDDPDPCPGHFGGCDRGPLRSFKKKASKYQDDDRPIDWNKLACWLKTVLGEKAGRPDLVKVVLKFFKDKSTVKLNPAKARWFLRRINQWIQMIRDCLEKPLHHFFGKAYKAIKTILRNYHVELQRGSGIRHSGNRVRRSDGAGLNKCFSNSKSSEEKNQSTKPKGTDRSKWEQLQMLSRRFET